MRHQTPIRKFPILMHIVDADHLLHFSEANSIEQGSDKGIQLMKEANFSERTPINRRIDLHPTYRDYK